MEAYRKIVVMEITRSIDILEDVKTLRDRLDKRGEGEEEIKDN